MKHIVSKKSIYIDILESKNKDNGIIQDNHVRFKSVPTSCVKHTANKENRTPIELFKQWFNGDKIKFDLLGDGNKCGSNLKENLV